MSRLLTFAACAVFASLVSWRLQVVWDRYAGIGPCVESYDCEAPEGGRSLCHAGVCYNRMEDSRTCAEDPDSTATFSDGSWCFGGARDARGRLAKTWRVVWRFVYGLRWADVVYGLRWARPRPRSAVAGATATLGSPSADAGAVVAACVLIGRVAGQMPSDKDWMLDVGAIDAVVAAMRRWPDDKDVQVTCTDAMGTMCLYNRRSGLHAGSLGGVELIVGIMRRWPDDPRMSLGGASGCLMDFVPENRQRWQDAGGIEVNLQAARRHVQDAGAVVQCWYGFSSGTQEPNALPFIRAGGPEVGIESMRAHPPQAGGGRVREEVMQAMRTPMQYEEGRNRLAAGGYIQDLVQAMLDAPRDYHTLSPACANLWGMCRGNATHLAQAITAGAAAAAFDAVLHYPSMKGLMVGGGWAEEYDAQYTVYDDCLAFLHVAASDCGVRRTLLGAGAAEVAAEAMSTGDRKAKQLAGGAVAQAGWTSNGTRLERIAGSFLERLREPCRA